MTVSAFIGLGANLDDPGAHIALAFDELGRLPKTALTGRSSLWRSAPVGYANQPDFINAVARVETGLAADALLGELQRIELGHGRERSFANAPRTLDLDLLLYGDTTQTTPTLTLPHPRMHQRAFVLAPLLELAPDARIPGHGTVRDCLAEMQGQACERIA